MRRRMGLGLAGVLFVLLSIGSASANNVNIASGITTGQDTSADTLLVQFNLSWDNSWRDGVNRDAVWVFVKFSTDAGTTWSHATLKTAGTNPANFSRGSGTGIDIVVPSDKKGGFIERSGAGTGSVSTTAIQLVWDYGTDGVNDTDADSTNTLIKIFAVEMVQIPQSGFFVGDTSDGTNGEFEYGSASNVSPAVNSETGISFTNATADAWYYNTDSSTDDETSGTAFVVSSAFPKGYDAFYLMKYEITQGQYAEFLNTLTSAQASNRYPNQNGNDRHTISGTYPEHTASRSDRAANYLSWMDLAAYADWAALRPMTEFEFEKACRGPISPVNAEYAWGTTSINVAVTISGTEDGTETITTSGANVNYNNGTFTGGDGSGGPLRAGIFATSGSTRTQAGAGYYGVLDLSGNVWERTVTVGNAAGRSYSGTHGDGSLSTVASYEGNATNSDWSGIDTTLTTRGVTGADGAGFRGGAWDETNVQRMSVSDRLYAGLKDATRRSDSGGRLVRTSP